MLSKKAQYALQALMYMAEKEDNQPTLIAEIAKKRRIPLKFLENILLELKNSGILESKKEKEEVISSEFLHARFHLRRLSACSTAPLHCCHVLVFIFMNVAKIVTKSIAVCTT